MAVATQAEISGFISRLSANSLTSSKPWDPWTTPPKPVTTAVFIRAIRLLVAASLTESRKAWIRLWNRAKASRLPFGLAVIPILFVVLYIFVMQQVLKDAVTWSTNYIVIQSLALSLIHIL